jgi:glycosyltransferase involved in cell wall biosynthesis
MLKIAQISPLCESVPPRAYGGTERIVAYLTDELVELGCEVTLFASAESRTRARLVPMRDQAIRLDGHPRKSECASHLTMLKQVQAMAHQFDLLHFHIEALHFPLFEACAHRTLTTLHGRLDFKDYVDLYRTWPQYPLVSISQRQRLPLPGANWVGNVPHGLPVSAYAFDEHTRGRYLAFLGRMSPEKRPDLAIRIARTAGIPLKIAAKVDSGDRDYFRDTIRPLLGDPLVEFIGEIGEAEKSEFLGNAIALLFPIDWPEPFGLVMVEAMACGTPVIAWNRGSVPEIIEDGVTGAIVESIDAAVDALRWAERADRTRIRDQFEKRFSARMMARRYLALYRYLLRSKKLELLPGTDLADSSAIAAKPHAITASGSSVAAASRLSGLA